MVEVAIELPRDRAGNSSSVIMAKRQRRLSSINEIVLSLHSRGLTTGDIAAHFAEIYDARVSKDTISRITDQVVEEMQAWTSRPLEPGPVYAAVVLDAINVNVRGQVTNRPVNAAIEVDLEGHKDISWGCGSATAAGSRHSFGLRAGDPLPHSLLH
jgi:putative transposase